MDVTAAVKDAARVAGNAGFHIGVEFQLRRVRFLNLQIQLQRRYSHQSRNFRSERDILAYRDRARADVAGEWRFDQRVVHGFARDRSLGACAGQRRLRVDHTLEILARGIERRFIDLARGIRLLLGGVGLCPGPIVSALRDVASLDQSIVTLCVCFRVLGLRHR